MTDGKDFDKLMQEALANLRPDPEKLQAALQAQAATGEVLGQAAIEAAGKSADLSADFTRQTIDGLRTLAASSDNPLAYGQALQDFAAAQGKLAQDQLSAFARVLREFQEQAVSTALKSADSPAVGGKGRKR